VDDVLREAVTRDLLEPLLQERGYGDDSSRSGLTQQEYNELAHAATELALTQIHKRIDEAAKAVAEVDNITGMRRQTDVRPMGAPSRFGSDPASDPVAASSNSTVRPTSISIKRVIRGIFFPRNPMWVEVSLEYNGDIWHKVGFRWKGGSSLKGAYLQESLKRGFRLEMDRFEDEFPATKDQRFYGFQKLTFSNAYDDDSCLKEMLVSGLYRAEGIKAASTAFYAIHLDIGDGYGPRFWGLYTAIEDPTDYLVKSFPLDLTPGKGNIYKPENNTWARFNAHHFEKKNNKDAQDFSDIKAAIAMVHSQDSLSPDPAVVARWRAGLRRVFDIDTFLKWLAIASCIGNWDSYGVMPHNYYLYNHNRTLRWIPWDHNLVLRKEKRMTSIMKNEVTEEWPLIRYILDDFEFRAQYTSYVEAFVNRTFQSIPETAQELHSLIKPYIIGGIPRYERGEEIPRHSMLSSKSGFLKSVRSIKTFVAWQTKNVEKALQQEAWYVTQVAAAIAAEESQAERGGVDDDNPCSPKKTIKSILECVDYNEKCEEWTTRGECILNPDWMLVNCRLSCDYCQISSDCQIPPAKGLKELDEDFKIVTDLDSVQIPDVPSVVDWEKPVLVQTAPASKLGQVPNNVGGGFVVAPTLQELQVEQPTERQPFPAIKSLFTGQSEQVGENFTGNDGDSPDTADSDEYYYYSAGDSADYYDDYYGDSEEIEEGANKVDATRSVGSSSLLPGGVADEVVESFSNISLGPLLPPLRNDGIPSVDASEFPQRPPLPQTPPITLPASQMLSEMPQPPQLPPLPQTPPNAISVDQAPPPSLP